MRVLIATPLYPPESGGPATYAKLLESGLPAQGLTVDIVQFADVRHLPKFIKHFIYFLHVLQAARSADLVLALDAVSVGFPALLAARLARRPFVVKIVGDYAWEQGRQRFGITASLDEFVNTKHVPFPVRILRRIEKRVARKAKRIIVPSAYLKNIVVAWGIREHKVTVIHNAVVPESVGKIPETVRVLPRPLVVSIGRLVPWKGFSELIDAVAALRSEGIKASLAIVGDGPERSVLEAKAKTLRDTVVLTGLLSHPQTQAVLSHADVFVLDSLYEGMSHAIIEAFAAGVPVVASDIGGNREIITDGENGLLVPPENPVALAHALKWVLSDDALRARLAARGKDSAALFSVEGMVGKTAECLRTLI